MSVLELNPFKKGDWVRCVVDYYVNNVTRGHLYEVLDANAHSVLVKDDSGNEVKMNFRAFSFPITKTVRRRHLVMIEAGRVKKTDEGGSDFSD
jgi:hypothetical protein